jgi:DNA-binding response OmpR family regulator
MKKILVIEDNDEVRENTSEILELSNYQVFTASNGKTGVEIALKEKPDLIVCDIMMPVLDGYGVLHLLNKHESTSGIPFIFLTAKSEKSDIRKGMESGADDYLMKPFDVTELLNAVEVRLQKAALHKRGLVNAPEKFDSLVKRAMESGAASLTSDKREVCSFKKRHILYSEGQRPKNVYFIISGKVKLYKTNEDGKKLITKIYGQGDFFGYTAMIDAVHFKDNAEILEDAELMLIPKQEFLDLITNDLQIAGQFIRIISHDIIAQEEGLLNFAYNSLRKKVAYGLIQLFDSSRSGGPAKEGSLEITRKNIAEVTGVATESLIRTLSDFREERLIDFDEGKIILLDEIKLRNLRN